MHPFTLSLSIAECIMILIQWILKVKTPMEEQEPLLSESISVPPTMHHSWPEEWIEKTKWLMIPQECTQSPILPIEVCYQ